MYLPRIKTLLNTYNTIIILQKCNINNIKIQSRYSNFPMVITMTFIASKKKNQGSNQGSIIVFNYHVSIILSCNSSLPFFLIFSFLDNGIFKESRPVLCIAPKCGFVWQFPHEQIQVKQVWQEFQDGYCVLFGVSHWEAHLL